MPELLRRKSEQEQAAILSRSKAGDTPAIGVQQCPDRAAVVTRAWEGETVAVIATGPSLKPGDLELVRGLRCIAVNDAYLVAPWAEVLYAADHSWWHSRMAGRKSEWAWGVRFTPDEVRQALADFKGQKVTIGHSQLVPDQNVLVLENDGADGLSERPDGIRTGQNSGYQAINIAVLAGAKRILLLGFDMKHTAGRTHAHNGHEVRTDDSSYRNYAKNFSKLENPLKALGVEVINCTPGSAIEAFPISTVEECLALTV